MPHEVELDFDPYAKIAVGEFDPVAKMVKPQSPKGPGTGTKEWTNYMIERRKGLKEIDYDRHREGTARNRATKSNRQQAEEQALERLVPKALKVLKAQLESPDERVQQSAAVKVLEYARGKPVQKLQAEVAGIQKIVYESAAFIPSPENGAVDAAQVLELLPALEDDSPEGDPEAPA